MRISELEKILAEIREKYGDLNVKYCKPKKPETTEGYRNYSWLGYTEEELTEERVYFLNSRYCLYIGE